MQPDPIQQMRDAMPPSLKARLAGYCMTCPGKVDDLPCDHILAKPDLAPGGLTLEQLLDAMAWAVMDVLYNATHTGGSGRFQWQADGTGSGSWVSDNPEAIDLFLALYAEAWRRSRREHGGNLLAWARTSLTLLGRLHDEAYHLKQAMTTWHTDDAEWMEGTGEIPPDARPVIGPRTPEGLTDTAPSPLQLRPQVPGEADLAALWDSMDTEQRLELLEQRPGLICATPSQEYVDGLPDHYGHEVERRPMAGTDAAKKLHVKVATQAKAQGWPKERVRTFHQSNCPNCGPVMKATKAEAEERRKEVLRLLP